MGQNFFQNTVKDLENIYFKLLLLNMVLHISELFCVFIYLYDYILKSVALFCHQIICLFIEVGKDHMSVAILNIWNLQK